MQQAAPWATARDDDPGGDAGAHRPGQRLHKRRRDGLSNRREKMLRHQQHSPNRNKSELPSEKLPRREACLPSGVTESHQKDRK